VRASEASPKRTSWAATNTWFAPPEDEPEDGEGDGGGPPLEC
jgi:hypothetical protein